MDFKEFKKYIIIKNIKSLIGNADYVLKMYLEYPIGIKQYKKTMLARFVSIAPIKELTKLDKKIILNNEIKQAKIEMYLCYLSSTKSGYFFEDGTKYKINKKRKIKFTKVQK